MFSKISILKAVCFGCHLNCLISILAIAIDQTLNHLILGAHWAVGTPPQVAQPPQSKPCDTQSYRYDSIAKVQCGLMVALDVDDVTESCSSHDKRQQSYQQEEECNSLKNCNSQLLSTVSVAPGFLSM